MQVLQHASCCTSPGRRSTSQPLPVPLRQHCLHLPIRQRIQPLHTNGSTMRVTGWLCTGSYCSHAQHRASMLDESKVYLNLPE